LTKQFRSVNPIVQISNPKSVFLKILFEFHTSKTFKATEVMIHPEGWWILRHGRDVLEIVEKVLVEFHLDVIELLNALALIHKV
jgi:hypothetical protein